jgi:hypothetical protein
MITILIQRKAHQKKSPKTKRPLKIQKKIKITGTGKKN